MMCDYPSCSTHTKPKARKEHICEECGGVITKGELYQRITGIWNGRGETHKTCMDCVAIRCEATGDYDDCIPFGCLGEDLTGTLAVRFKVVKEARKKAS